MEPHQAFEELDKNLEEIKKQNRLIRLREVLKFLLIGLLVRARTQSLINRRLHRTNGKKLIAEKKTFSDYVQV